MWDIDQRAQLGCEVPEKDKDYFNKYYSELLEKLKEDYEHFKHHSGELK